VKAPTLSAFGFWGPIVPAERHYERGGRELDMTGGASGARTRLCGLLLILVWWGASLAASPVSTAGQSGPVRVPILVYHAVDESGTPYSVTPRRLNEQCRWLVENGYTTITLRHFWRATRGLADLPLNPVILTNDDGDFSARKFAKILDRYGLVGAYFVNNVSPLTRRQIRSLAQSGAVEAHAVSHVALSELDYTAQLAEIADNRVYLEQITGQPVRFLAWPYGDENESAIQAAAAGGIVAAFGLGGTTADLDAIDRYAIPRITIYAEDDLAAFVAKVRWS
jgi:peptidoglycan/xylan/chitin deacetylase (PgdA/CDA1 family)